MLQWLLDPAKVRDPAELNYYIGNRELLVVRLALGEWRHWLEGAARPFLVWTDHKNLEYIHSAKRLNARQARWALFFGWLNFYHSYRPGSKNTKPDALSHLFEGPGRDAAPDTILPKWVVVASLSWDVERWVNKGRRRSRGGVWKVSCLCQLRYILRSSGEVTNLG